MNSRMNRRRFLRTATGAASSLVVLRDSRSASSYQANEELGVAVVGAGKRGAFHARTVPRIDQNLVAICDANQEHAAELAKKHPKVSLYRDFRKMLDEMDRQIDAIIVVTPDHTHAVIAITAMRRGKHVYVEKPCAHDVSEGRALRRIARERKVATQMGNQGMASDSFRRTLRRIKQGAVGEIREAHVWFVMGGSGPRKRPKEKPPVPKHLDWDLWLGPAPFRPYHPNYVRWWGGWRDFGTGTLGGCGSHGINMVFKALNLRALWEDTGGSRAPIRIEAEFSERCVEGFPRWQIVRFDVPARGALPPARIHWYSARERELRRQGIWQRLEKIAGRSLEWSEGWTPRSGSLLVGSKGVVHTNGHNSQCQLLPLSEFPDPAGPPGENRFAERHLREWSRACKGGPAPISNFDHSGPAMELLLLGNVATQVEGQLEFDPVAMKIANNAKADGLLRPERREGWAL
jgi:hypothetical protein